MPTPNPVRRRGIAAVPHHRPPRVRPRVAITAHGTNIPHPSPEAARTSAVATMPAAAALASPIPPIHVNRRIDSGFNYAGGDSVCWVLVAFAAGSQRPLATAWGGQKFVSRKPACGPAGRTHLNSRQP